jgi:hypothetical protein
MKAEIVNPQIARTLDLVDPFEEDRELDGLRDVRLDELEVTEDHRNAVAWHMYEALGWLGDDIAGHDAPTANP